MGNEIQEHAFYISSVMGARKEQAYRAAITSYFGDLSWNEDLLEKHAGVNIDSDGTETFFIGKTNLVRFGPLKSNTVIEDNKVICLFSQEIKELYK